MKQRVYEVMEISPAGDRASQIFSFALIALIIVNAVSLVISTVESVYQSAPLFFDLLETIILAIFTVEYGVRLWAATADPQYASPIRGRLRFALTPLAFVDLIAILPSFVAALAGILFGVQLVDLSLLRAVRLVSRVAKMSRYSTGVRALGRVMMKKREELLTVIVVLLVLLLVSSSLMYFAERAAQPDVFASIPAAMWWSIITLTTVGYGDVFPVTSMGRIIGGMIAILGIGLFALPAGILGSGFLEEVQSRRNSQVLVCPHCGEEIR
jgi:voltage-gated potassium channel